VPVRRYRNEDEGRDIFKALRNQHLRDTCALLYYTWAGLEQHSGNTSKAVSLLEKGLAERAEPRR
jgi:serine/threonine-protein kinase TTK/MPS1